MRNIIGGVLGVILFCGLYPVCIRPLVRTSAVWIAEMVQQQCLPRPE